MNNNLGENGGLLFWGPSILAGCVCGVVVNLDKSLLINAVPIAIVAATIVTTFTAGLKDGGVGIAIIVTGSMCTWIVAFSMIISGLGLMAFLKLFGG